MILMKTKKLETLVLAAAGAIIIAALVFLFVLDSNPNSSLWVNILLATGFLLYIVYNVLTSSNYNKQVEALEAQVEAETAAKEEAQKEVAQLTTDLEATKKQLSKSTMELDSLRAEKGTLQGKIAYLEATLKDLQAETTDPAKENSESEEA